MIKRPLIKELEGFIHGIRILNPCGSLQNSMSLAYTDVRLPLSDHRSKSLLTHLESWEEAWIDYSIGGSLFMLCACLACATQIHCCGDGSNIFNNPSLHITFMDAIIDNISSVSSTLS